MSERALKSVENARRVLDRATETLKGGNAVTVGEDGKENAPATAVAAVGDDRAVDALKELVNDMNIGGKGESCEREIKDEVVEKPAAGTDQRSWRRISWTSSEIGSEISMVFLRRLIA